MSKMYALLTVLCFCIFQANGGFFEGESCEQNGRQGKCRNIRKCSSAIADIKNKKFPLQCSFVGSDPIVCCFDGEGSSSTAKPKPTTTPYVPTVADYRFDNNNGEVDCVPIPSDMTSMRTGRKAWDKCIEYQEKYVYPCEKSVALTGQAGRSNKCGHNADELILGGVDAKFGEFPHMALLGYGNDANTAQWLCGGSIISEKFILTAGHCTFSRDAGPVTFVRLETLKRSDPIDSTRVHRVGRIVKHPNYDPPRKYNDIALLETETEMSLNQYAVPACLPVGSSYKDTNASAIGFGATEYRGQSANHLQKVTITKFTYEECSRKYPSERLMKQGVDNETQICYGDKALSKDTCQGDSGGPLQINSKEVHCMFVVVGVTSFGKACGYIGQPGIYTRVSSYTPWIESVVWP